MFTTVSDLRALLLGVAESKHEQGHQVDELVSAINRSADSCDRLVALAEQLERSPLRDSWPYREPNNWDVVLGQWDPQGSAAPIGTITQ